MTTDIINEVANKIGALARKYSVDRSTIQAVLNNETWRNNK